MPHEDLDDPTDFEGVALPASLDQDDNQKRAGSENLFSGTSAAGARAICSQLIAFYFRAPVKAFLRMRVDYMQVARAINPKIQANERWSLRMSTPGLLAHAVKHHGWEFIPKQVLPPLVANAGVGAILYTSYLSMLSVLHEPSSHSTKRVYPPPPYLNTFGAGFVAGGIQSLVAAPLDALSMRFDVNEMLEGRHNSMWSYGYQKLKEIGLRGIFAGYGFSFLKESLGCAFFFSSFEFAKHQCYYTFLTYSYGQPHFLDKLRYFSENSVSKSYEHEKIIIKPHYALEPAFLLLAGATASISQQAIFYPITLIQNVHYGRLESLDYASKFEPRPLAKFPRWKFLLLRQSYEHSYAETLKQIHKQSELVGGLKKFLYKGFWTQTIRQIPSTSAGLIVFEIVRRKFAIEGEGIIVHHNGYDILLA